MLRYLDQQPFVIGTTYARPRARLNSTAVSGLLLMVTHLATWGCREQTPSSSNGAMTLSPSAAASGDHLSTTPPSGAAEGKAPSAQPEAIPSLSSDAVRTLVTAWISAQNASNFDAYASHYAERFTGTKRAGERVTHFDRKSWLDDRKPMFTPDLHVAANDVEVHLAGATARVRFVQEFKTARFADRGTKELIVTSTTEGPRIAREEMLQSNLLGTGSNTMQGGYFIDAQVVFLGQTVPAEAIAPTGKLDGEQIPPHHGIQHDVDPQLLSSAQRALLGQRLTTFDARGQQCEAAIEHLSARADVVPHFGMVQRWQGAEGTPAATPAQIASDLWSMTGPSVVKLVGKLDGCPDALWGASKAPKGKVLPARKSQGAATELVKRELATLPQIQSVQRDFELEHPLGTKAKWYEQRGITVHDFEPIDGTQTLIASTTIGDGCAEFSASLSVLFEVDVRAAPQVRRHVVLGERVLTPRLAMDLEADGQFELLAGPDDLPRAVTLWTRGRSNTYRSHELWSLLFWDCAC